MTPLFTIIISIILYRKRHSRQTYLSLVPVILGVVFATFGDYSFTAWGFILTLLGTLLAAMKTIITNRVQVGRLKLHPLDLLVRMSPLAFMQCVFFGWWSGELDRVREYGATEMTQRKAIALAVNGAIAFGLNVVSFTANKKTSALTMTVAGSSSFTLPTTFRSLTDPSFIAFLSPSFAPLSSPFPSHSQRQASPHHRPGRAHLQRLPQPDQRPRYHPHPRRRSMVRSSRVFREEGESSSGRFGTSSGRGEAGLGWVARGRRREGRARGKQLYSISGFSLSSFVVVVVCCTDSPRAKQFRSPYSLCDTESGRFALGGENRMVDRTVSLPPLFLPSMLRRFSPLAQQTINNSRNTTTKLIRTMSTQPDVYVAVQDGSPSSAASSASEIQRLWKGAKPTDVRTFYNVGEESSTVVAVGVKKVEGKSGEVEENALKEQARRAVRPCSSYPVQTTLTSPPAGRRRDSRPQGRLVEVLPHRPSLLPSLRHRRRHPRLFRLELEDHLGRCR
jgi:hypothetical protein